MNACLPCGEFEVLTLMEDGSWWLNGCRAPFAAVETAIRGDRCRSLTAGGGTRQILVRADRHADAAHLKRLLKLCAEDDVFVLNIGFVCDSESAECSDTVAVFWSRLAMHDPFRQGLYLRAMIQVERVLSGDVAKDSAWTDDHIRISTGTRTIRGVSELSSLLKIAWNAEHETELVLITEDGVQVDDVLQLIRVGQVSGYSAFYWAGVPPEDEEE